MTAFAHKLYKKETAEKESNGTFSVKGIKSISKNGVKVGKKHLTDRKAHNPH
jgi:hypothetical protein